MLKNSLLLLFAVLIVAGSCTKKPSTVIPEKVIDTMYIDTTHVDTSNIDTSFIVHIADLLTNPVGKVNLPIEVLRNTATEKKITLSLKDIPANVKAELSSEGGYPDFTSMLMLDFMFQPRGVYPIKVVATPEGGKAKEYTVKLTVDSMDKKECNTFLNSSFRTLGSTFKSDKDDSTYYFSQFVLFNNTLDGGIYLRNLPLYTDSVNLNGWMSLRSINTADPNNTSAHIKVMLDCDSGKISIPLQEVVARKITGPTVPTNFIIYGNGTVDAKKKTYEITYFTQPVVAGTPAPTIMTLKGEFIY